MSTTVKGQVTIPKAVRDAAGIRPGDRVTVRAGPDGTVIVGKAETDALADLEERLAELRRREIRATISGDEVMCLTRDDDA
jgi:antitoxin PrlF